MNESPSDLRLAMERLGLPGPGEPPQSTAAAPAGVEPPAGGEGPPFARRHGVALVTRCTRDHLPYARILAASLEHHHPEIDLFVVVTDPDPFPGPEAASLGGARLVPVEALGLGELDFLRLKLSAAQLCMAVKPAACRWVAGLGYAKVLSFDADIEVFAPLSALLGALDEATWVVTPHLLAPFPHSEKTWEHPTLFEIGSAGVFNNGLFGFVPGAASLAFLERWQEMVLAPGAFLDHQPEQNAFNWLSSFTDDVFVLRDPAYNVAYWNLHDRSLRWRGLDEGSSADAAADFTVDGEPLVAFHFSGLPLDEKWRLSVHDYRHSIYLLPSVAVLVESYRDKLRRHGLAAVREQQPYRFARWPSGLAIDDRMRRVFQRGELELWRDVEAFSPAGEAYYGRALLRPASGTFLMPALLWEIYRERPDVQMHFPDARIAPGRLIEWFCTEGAEQLGYLALLDRWRPTLPRREALLHLHELVADSPPAFGDLAEPLGKDRPVFLARLARLDRRSEARGVRGLDAEIWAPSPLAAVRELVKKRADLRASFPDYLGENAGDLADWLEGDGIASHGLPPGYGELFRRKAGGHALGRLYSFFRRHRWLQETYGFAFVGEKSEIFATAILERWPADCEFDLDDVAMFLWEMEERPWLGLAATLEAPVHAGRSPSPLEPAGQEALLAPFLERPGFREALADWRRRRPAPGVPLAAAGRGPARAASQRGINCFGYFKSPIGLGHLSRGMALALERAGFTVARQLHGIMEMSEDLKLDDFVGSFRHDFSDNLFVSYPHLHARLLQNEPPACVAGRRNIVYLAWEQRDGHPFWREVFGDFDQIWALSSFAAKAIGRACGREVLAVPAALDFAALPPAASPREVGLDPELCTFLYVFDANSSIERKNPAAAIEAFRRAFGPGDRVELLLKASHLGRLEHRRQLWRLEELAARTGLRIRFATQHLARRDLLRLISAAGAYVSLHRAEGFGYTCAEAMAYGVPVIATAYSGNLDFMDDTSACLVRAAEVEVKVPDGPFQRGSIWAEPDLDHAAELMRRVYQDRQAACELGARGAAYVREKLSLERIAALVGKALR